MLSLYEVATVTERSINDTGRKERGKKNR